MNPVKDQWEAEVMHEGKPVVATIRAYRWETGWRFVVTLPKQKIYWEYAEAESFNRDEVVKHFTEHRLELDHAKCVRCGKWHVVTGMYCDRCVEAIDKSGGDGETYEILSDGTKKKC